MRVRRTVAFIDLSGFTALTEARGDESAVRVLTAFRTEVREVCSRRGVRIAKWLGDGAMLVGVETEPVVATALELQRCRGTDSEPMAIRCGVTTGSVLLMEGDDYVGHDVNLAARLCEMAVGHEVLATVAVGRALPRWGAVVGTAEVPVRGTRRSVEVLRLGLRLRPEESRTDPVCGIPLDEDVAAARVTGSQGEPVLFCSDSCLELWKGRLGGEDDPDEEWWRDR